MEKRPTEILAATGNAGKLKELAELLAEMPFRLRGLKDFPNVVEPAETGSTFADNAVLKARSYARQTNLWSLADDSGLEVAALSGAPGIFSARYGGAAASDADRTEKLLSELEKTPDRERRARFVCAMALTDETGAIKFLEQGVCDGEIAFAARGANGFGYDPIFIPDGFSQTFGELAADTKQQISHRGRAARKIIQQLRRFYAALT